MTIIVFYGFIRRKRIGFKAKTYEERREVKRENGVASTGENKPTHAVTKPLNMISGVRGRTKRLTGNAISGNSPPL